jgi:hypothetical protein
MYRAAIANITIIVDRPMGVGGEREGAKEERENLLKFFNSQSYDK